MARFENRPIRVVGAPERFIREKVLSSPNLEGDLQSSGEDPVEQHRVEVPTECTFRTGPAGTGKTRFVQDAIEKDATWGTLSATTGIAAVNLGTTTINSVLGFFDLASIMDAYSTGRLHTRLAQLAKSTRRLAIDEISMMHGEVLDVLFLAIKEVNQRSTTKKPLGLYLTGDFCQLPPVKDKYNGTGKWVFDSDCWPAFADNIVRLSKIWRQDDTAFLEALQAARRGNGPDAAERLEAIPGITWRMNDSFKFDGTTIVGTNDQADKINHLALMQLPGKVMETLATRWGKQRGEWSHIPDKLQLKKGALVMILSNDPDPNARALGMLAYANGSCGHIVGFSPSGYDVELVDLQGNPTGRIVKIGMIEREFTSKEKEIFDYKTKKWIVGTEQAYDGNLRTWVDARLHVNGKKRRYIFGGIRYMPLRPAYASTVHKSQGLTLNKVQVDVRHHFMGSPAMVYVALSRVKTPGGLTIIGDPTMLGKRVKVDQAVLPWL